MLLYPMYVGVEMGTLLLVTLSQCSIEVSIFLPHHDAGGCWLVQVP
jgi:hypothetical protein